MLTRCCILSTQMRKQRTLKVKEFARGHSSNKRDIRTQAWSISCRNPHSMHTTNPSLPIIKLTVCFKDESFGLI